MSKYGARKTEVDGHMFDSKAEARRYGELKLMQQAGVIEGLTLQPRFPIEVNGVKICTYIADFLYFDVERGERVIADVKGMKTPTYRLKKKLMRACHGIDVEEVPA